jgi:asparagine synthase (glutamine-hydrolysing)
MSGLAGVRWLNTRVATVADLRAPLGAVAHRGPDGLFAVVDGPCALGIAHNITTPEARHERQPFTTSRGLVVAFDGRLDNTADLRARLGGSDADAAPDVELLAAAWQAWGEATFERLLGDFALSIWDPHERSLWLARDVFGLRPLLYRTYAGGFWWASELRALARLGDTRANEGIIGEYLSDRMTSESETLVSGVLRVPRASVVRVSANGTVRTWRYWQPQAGPPRERSDGDAVEEFNALLSHAVQARLRSDRPLALMLSGGLDSGLIASHIDRARRCHAIQRVDAFTSAWPGSPLDESARAAAEAPRLQLS